MSAPISLEAALAELAVDPIGVLRASGVSLSGLRFKSPGCALVAAYIGARLDALALVSASGASVGNQSAELPYPVVEAIRAIDAGEHPELCR